MRLWSIHPACLDSKGLVAVWREGLLALAVLSGSTRGYVRHPQLIRFRNHPDPLAAITGYLAAIADEAERRGFRFDRSKLVLLVESDPMPVTSGQLKYEFFHLKQKLAVRQPVWLAGLDEMADLPVHPSFRVVDGGVESWEKIPGTSGDIRKSGTPLIPSGQSGLGGSA